MRLYWEVAKRGFRRYATYRAATAAGLFTNTIFGFLRAYVLIALLRVKPVIGGFDITDSLTYVWLTQAALMAIALWGWWDIAQSIKSGDVVTDLYRPYDYQAYWLAQDLGRAFYQILTRGFFPFIVGALVFHLRIPADPIQWVAFAFSVLLAVLVSFGIRFLMNLAVFWTLDERGIQRVGGTIWWVLAGFIVPLHFLPEPIRIAALMLPFASTIQVPIDVFLGKYTGAGLVGALAMQAGWAVVLLGTGRAVLAAASRRVVTQGG